MSHPAVAQFFTRLRSLTAKSRNDLARTLGRTNADHLLVLTADFRVIEFVLLERRRRGRYWAMSRQTRLRVFPA